MGVPVRVERMSRHLYDIEKFMNTPILERISEALNLRLKVEGNETVTVCHGLKMRAVDGKQREARLPVMLGWNWKRKQANRLFLH